MLRKQLFKQAAVCVLAAGMIMSNIPCTQVNGIYASVDVTNSVTVNLSQRIQVVSADSKSVYTNLYQHRQTHMLYLVREIKVSIATS